jgi:Cof subfamily protein (haloacid dehalogenase superfamily)
MGCNAPSPPHHPRQGVVTAKAARTLVVSDVDGTLLSRNAHLSEATIAATWRLVSHGIALVLASGRAYVSLEALGQEIAEPAGYIASNGNYVQVGTNPGQIVRRFGQDVVHEIFVVAQRHHAHAVCYMSDGMNYVATPDDELRSILGRYREPPVKASSVVEITQRVSDLIHIHLVKASGWGRDVLIAHATTARSVAEYLTITPFGVNKAEAVELLWNRPELCAAHTYVLGDGENDLPLFELPGVCSIGIGSGYPTLLSLADVVAPSVDDEGFAWAVDNVIIPNIRR